MKKALVLIILLLTVFFAGVVVSSKSSTPQDKRPYITVTNFALYDIVNKIVDNHVEVKKLIPFGVEMHSFTPSVKTMAELSKAELFIFTGLGMEPWIKKEYSNQMDMSRFVELKASCKDDHMDEDQENEHHHHKEASDPHYWLDVNNMKVMTETLLMKLSEHFPQHKDVFEKNANAYINELTALDNEYKQALETCKRSEIVVNHNAFGYLGEKYGFSSHSVTGLSPDEQVSAKKMKEITDLVKNEGIKIVFFESFVSPQVSETIAKETGAHAESLQPLANVKEDEANKGYVLLMQENLEKLTRAMECK